MCVSVLCVCIIIVGVFVCVCMCIIVRVCLYPSLSLCVSVCACVCVPLLGTCCMTSIRYDAVVEDYYYRCVLMLSLRRCCYRMIDIIGYEGNANKYCCCCCCMFIMFRRQDGNVATACEMLHTESLVICIRPFSFASFLDP
jgi:hypothetical protein